MTGSKPIEQEGEIILDHNYDGIKELDNSLPPWWLYGFYATIIFGAVYLIRYHVLGADNQYTELEKEYAEAERAIEEYKKTAKDLVDFNTVELLTDASDLNKGKFNEEQSALNPNSKYGLSKLSNENFASEFSEKFNIAFVGLRFFTVYGPRGRPDMAYYLFTELLKKKSCIPLINNGLMSRDMTFIDDITNGILGAIKFICDDSNSIRNEIFNLGNDNPITTINLLETIESKLNLKSEIKHIYSKNESKFTHADISKAKNLLGYDPEISFEQGMNRFLNWHNGYKK